MMTSVKIHQTAIVDSKAEVGEGCEVGPYSIIEAGAKIGDSSTIGSHVLITGFATLGSECHVAKGAVVGSPPQDLKFGGEESTLRVGDRTTIREFCTLNRGTEHDKLETVVGSDCLLMAYTHIAHDCIIGDNVILANAVNMAGHVTIEDYVNISGMTAIHQFVTIGRHCYIGGLSRVSQDVPPYGLFNGSPPQYYGPNSVGLKRRGFSLDQINSIKRAYHHIYQTGQNLSQSVEAIEKELEITPEIKVILDFIRRAERGVTGRK